MKLSLQVVLASSIAVSAFQPSSVTPARRLAPLAAATFTGAVDLSEGAQRDVYTLQDWARNCGAQTAEGFELTSQDGFDWSVITNQDLPAGSPVLYVPAEMVVTSSSVEQEFGGNLEGAENALTQYEGTAQRIPLFRLMVKILAEYEKGAESPFYPWMNSLPRTFYNGVAMTDACFECLPPYAAWLAKKERNNYSRFLGTLRKGYLPLSQQTLDNDNLVQWAYNVALTRFNEVWSPRREKKIAPLADMFNHATNPNVAVTYDDQGNCVVTATVDVPAGSPLSISLGDPTNPTPLFATYGFLYDDCTTIFCKAMHLENEIKALDYEFKDLLFYTETGDIAPKVWDIFLYKLLENDPDNLGAFYTACKTNDEGTKQGYHGQYFAYTLEAIKEHVNTILGDVDSLTMKANSYDVRTHPRVPVIVAHNDLVKRTLSNVKAQLDTMG